MKMFMMPCFVGRYCGKKRGLVAAALVVALLFSGCGMLPPGLAGPALDLAPDLALFQKGVESLHDTSSPEAFSRLATDYPDSPWTSRAKAIEKALGRAKEEQREQNQFEEKLEECRVEKQRLLRDVRSLEEYTLRLKSLLTEAGIAEPVPPSR